ncbi:hypothetical protein V8E51_019803 [Hyaloscypha variabilis]
MAAEQNPNSITASLDVVEQALQTTITPESYHIFPIKSLNMAKEQDSGPQYQNLPAISLANTVQQTPQASQTPTNLNTFTCFPLLPIEIRFKIWHFTFPRAREVNFGNELLFRTVWRYIPREIFQFEDELPLPIALCVNRGSRRETLKHYTVLFRGDSPLPRPQVVIPYFEPPPGIPRFNEEDLKDGEDTDEMPEVGNKGAGTDHELPVRQIERPFCHNPRLDTAWINPITLQKDYCTQQPDNWLSYLASAAPSVFTETRFLEIRGVHSVWPSRVVLGSRSGFCVLYSTSVHGTLPFGTMLKPILQFQRLEILKLIPCRGGTGCVYSSLLRDPFFSAVEYLKGIEEFLEEHKDDFGGKAPILIVSKPEE